MESPIPLPTDNIYKFYALFGLSLFIFFAGASIYNEHATNDTILQTIIENAAITDTNSPEAAGRKEVLEKRYELAVGGRKEIDKLLTAGVFLGTALVILGFASWQFITQPVQDEIAKLQRDKLRIEVEQLRKSGSTGPVKEEPLEESSQPEA